MSKRSTILLTFYAGLTGRVFLFSAFLLPLYLLTLSGCTKAPDAPATRPATTVPTTLPTSATFQINGKPAVFAAPRIMLDHRGGPSRLLIYSDNENALGSFYFEVPLDDDSPADQPMHWEMRNQQKDREDTLIGIDLSAESKTLQPTQLSITIAPPPTTPGQTVQITLTGRFLLYTPDSDTPAATLPVQATFPAALIRPTK